jgi:hypothetical protein
MTVTMTGITMQRERQQDAWEELLSDSFHHLYLTASAGHWRFGAGALGLWAFDQAIDTPDDLVQLPRKYFSRVDLLEAVYKVFGDDTETDLMRRAIDRLGRVMEQFDPENEICVVVFGGSEAPLSFYRLRRPESGLTALSACPISLN